MAFIAYIGLWLVAYAIGAITLRLIWRRSAAYPGAFARVALRSFWFAFAFTPAVAACGAVAVVPFPLLLLGELILPPSEVCGPFVPPNLILVGLAWFTSSMLYAALMLATRHRRRR